MTSTIESVDNLPKLPPQDRVNETERSSPEDQRKQFKKALKDTLEEEKRKEKKRHQTDSVVLEKIPDDRLHLRHQAPHVEPVDTESGAPDKEKEEQTSSGKHIDLKA
jgi:hypothetical protein